MDPVSRARLKHFQNNPYLANQQRGQAPKEEEEL
jgi:hypothetical protein